jgi:uncharacterized protein
MTNVFEDLDPDALYPPLPYPDALTRFFWEGVAEHRLLILQCNDCGFFIHWPREICRNCRSKSLAPTPVSGVATLATWTFPNQPYDPYYQSHMPYALAVVELIEQVGLKMVTNLVDYDRSSLRIDMPLRVAFREVARGVTFPLFAPASSGISGSEGVQSL